MMRPTARGIEWRGDAQDGGLEKGGILETFDVILSRAAAGDHGDGRRRDELNVMNIGGQNRNVLMAGQACN